MWLDDGTQHAFPMKTPEDNYIPFSKACLEKDFEYKEINKKYDNQKEKYIFSSLKYKVTKLLSSSDRKSIVRSLKRVSTSLMTCQKLYSAQYDRYGKQEIDKFDRLFI